LNYGDKKRAESAKAGSAQNTIRRENEAASSFRRGGKTTDPATI
jgi:hypothetical protein